MMIDRVCYYFPCIVQIINFLYVQIIDHGTILETH